MAATGKYMELFSVDISQLTKGESDLKCVNCAAMQKQLHSVLLELKSAETIISLLREDRKNNTPDVSAVRQCTTPLCVTSEGVTCESEQHSEKWTTVVSKNNKVKVTCDSNIANVKHHLVFNNKFAPLLAVPENQDEMIDYTSNCKRPQFANPKTVNSTQLSTGWKIPTIVNGRTISNYSVNKKPIRNKSKQLNTFNQRPIKAAHKVEIIGDSHLKGSAGKINQYLNTKFKVSGLTKPGASVIHVVGSQEENFKGLGKSDVIVINGGSNDIDKGNYKVNAILILLVHFIQKYSNTNIVIVNIPHRHDLLKVDKTNICIQAFNSKLKNIVKSYKHVSLVEMSMNRRHYTKYGLHLNNGGKEWLAKQIAIQTGLLVAPAVNVSTVIPLQWIEEAINTSKEIDMLTVEGHNVEDPTLSDQSPNNKCNMGKNELTRRTSSRNKKAPSTMSTDFLW